jgi:hypothetical protein
LTYVHVTVLNSRCASIYKYEKYYDLHPTFTNIMTFCAAAGDLNRYDKQYVSPAVAMP